MACGDVNGDGKVDPVDALLVLRYIAGLGPYASHLGYGFTSCDGAISAVDALIILRYVAGLPLNLPEGCPPIGYPPT